METIPVQGTVLAAAGHGFEVAILIVGLLLIAGAALAALAHRSLLSLTALFVLAGFALGPDGAELLSFDARSRFVAQLAIVALVVILLRDGLEVERELLASHWHLPLRKLVLAMPLTAALIALAARALTDLSWTEAFLLGALLSPTDPVLSSSVVTNPRVPRVVRHSLNLESGLNDGLALPAVLALAAALRVGQGHFVAWRFVVEDLGLGLACGLAVGYLASRLWTSRGAEHDERETSHATALYLLGVAFAAYGVAVASHGNGLIAVFVCAIVIGVRRPDLRSAFQRGGQPLVELSKLGIFVVFGSLLTIHGLFAEGWGAVAIVAFTLLVARPVAIWIALAGTSTDRATKAFIAWFGPKGVATMTFSLIILGDSIPNNLRIFNLAAVTVFASIILHGLTDTPGTTWIARHTEQRTAANNDGGASARP
ncbi:MAG TPA: cation:proton antiporter [Solirubrobacteraceae bacterium]|nr:cation:proton antiporter [Solirubrobacteraceae bacterium]